MSIKVMMVMTTTTTKTTTTTMLIADFRVLTFYFVKVTNNVMHIRE